MNLKPVYHRDDKLYRVIYRPHNQWVAQHLVPITDLTIDRRVTDPWRDIGKVKPTRDEALSVMHLHKPLRNF